MQNTGHADLVQRPNGSWAMVYLGVRPRGTSPKWHVIGRETFGAEIMWVDGWPQLGAPIEPASAATDLITERLDGPELSMSWVSPGRFPIEVFGHEDDGWRLRATREDPAADDLSFVGRRQAHLCARVTAVVRATDAVGGLSVRIDSRHHLDLEVADGALRAVAQIGEIRAVLGEVAIEAGKDVVLQLRVEPAHGSFFSTKLGPDLLVAAVVGDDGFVELGQLDGRYLSTELAAGFTGRMVGFYCRAGVLDICSFECQGIDDPVASRTE